MSIEVSSGRLACAVDARVVAHRTIGDEHVALDLSVAHFPPSDPGQFLQLLCREGVAAPDAACDWPAHGFPALADAELRQPQAFLRRPFSLADRTATVAGGAVLCVIAHVVGPGTAWLARLHVGDIVSVTGPLGRGFALPPADQPIVLVGGGVGIPPLLYLARRLHETAHHDVTLILGTRARRLLPVGLTKEPAADGTPSACLELPGGAPYPIAVTSDDGSVGQRGVVTAALESWCTRRPDAVRGALVCACGPEAMLKAVARFTRLRELDCQLCIERSMGCGMGTCLSCIVRAREPSRPRGWRWALACTDGPVFARDDLLDYAADPRA